MDIDKARTEISKEMADLKREQDRKGWFVLANDVIIRSQGFIRELEVIVLENAEDSDLGLLADDIMERRNALRLVFWQIEEHCHTLLENLEHNPHKEEARELRGFIGTLREKLEVASSLVRRECKRRMFGDS